MAIRIRSLVETDHRPRRVAPWLLTALACSLLLVAIIPFLISPRPPGPILTAFYPDMSAISELSVSSIPAVAADMPEIPGLDLPVLPKLEIQLIPPAQRQESAVANKLMAINQHPATEGAKS